MVAQPPDGQCSVRLGATMSPTTLPSGISTVEVTMPSLLPAGGISSTAHDAVAGRPGRPVADRHGGGRLRLSP